MLVRTAAQLAPSDPESQLLLGYALNNFGESKLALAALERYRSLDPTGRDADDLIATLRASTQQADPASQGVRRQLRQLSRSRRPAAASAPTSTRAA